MLPQESPRCGYKLTSNNKNSTGRCQARVPTIGALCKTHQQKAFKETVEKTQHWLKESFEHKGERLRLAHTLFKEEAFKIWTQTPIYNQTKEEEGFKQALKCDPLNQELFKSFQDWEFKTKGVEICLRDLFVSQLVSEWASSFSAVIYMSPVIISAEQWLEDLGCCIQHTSEVFPRERESGAALL